MNVQCTHLLTKWREAANGELKPKPAVETEAFRLGRSCADRNSTGRRLIDLFGL